MNDKWDKRFIELAKHISTWSKDPSTQLGAVIVDNKKRVVSVGFNGYPQNIPDDNTLHDRKEKYLKVIHAEVNAILFANRDLNGCTIYVYPMGPCARCTGTIIQSGIVEVITVFPSDELLGRWGEEIRISERMFKSAQVRLKYLTIDI